jgi:hypothetical protein
MRYDKGISVAQYKEITGYGDRVSMAKLRENLEHLKHMPLGAGFSHGPSPVMCGKSIDAFQAACRW